MEKRLKRLFDYQKFAGNKELAKQIYEGLETSRVLDMDLLAGVAAAGEFLDKQKEDSKQPDTCK